MHTLFICKLQINIDWVILIGCEDNFNAQSHHTKNMKKKRHPHKKKETECRFAQLKDLSKLTQSKTRELDEISQKLIDTRAGD